MIKAALKTALFLTLTHTFFLKAYGFIDLHAHLEMHPGMGPLSRLSFSSLKPKGHLSDLLRPDAPKLTVISLYAHPFLSNLLSINYKKNVQDGLRGELGSIERFVQENQDKIGIAKSATEAQALLQKQKRVIVLSIEGAYGAFETDEDYRYWIEEKGVAIVTPFHLTEDHFGGAALLQTGLAFFNAPYRFIESILLTGGQCLKTFCKSQGTVSADGRNLIQKLIDQKTWIDLAHANDLELAEILPILAEKKLPIIVTHTSAREYYHAERAIASPVIEAIKKQGGIIGLIPSDQVLNYSPESCYSGISLFKAEFALLAKAIGANRIGMGSDTNAPLSPLSAICKSEPNRILNQIEQTGYHRFNQLRELGDLISPTPDWHELVLKEFLANWKKIRP